MARPRIPTRPPAGSARLRVLDVETAEAHLEDPVAFNKAAVAAYLAEANRLVASFRPECGPYGDAECVPLFAKAVGLSPFLVQRIGTAASFKSLISRLGSEARRYMTQYSARLEQAQQQFAAGTALVLPRHAIYALLAALFFSPGIACFVRQKNARSPAVTKLAALLIYFLVAPHTTTEPDAVIFLFNAARAEQLDRLRDGPLRLEVRDPVASMLDAVSSQVALLDFANMFLGGGALVGSTMLEQLLCVECPELYAGALLCGFGMRHDQRDLCIAPPSRRMESDAEQQAISVVGALRFVCTEGSGDAFSLCPDDPALFAKMSTALPLRCFSVGGSRFAVRATFVGAADSARLTERMDVSCCFTGADARRHAAKIVAAFEPLVAPCSHRLLDLTDGAAVPDDLAPLALGSVACGNWGCGSFRSDVRARLLQQLIGLWLLGVPTAVDYPRERQSPELLAELEAFVTALNEAAACSPPAAVADAALDWDSLETAPDGLVRALTQRLVSLVH